MQGDPFWMDAKYPGRADDGSPVRKGDRILYWPRTKTVMVGKKAEDAWRNFKAEAQDEDFYNARYASEFVQAWGPLMKQAAEEIEPDRVPGQEAITRILGHEPSSAWHGIHGYILMYPVGERYPGKALQELATLRSIRWWEASRYGGLTIGL